MTRTAGGWVPDGRAKVILGDCEASLAALDGLAQKVLDLRMQHYGDKNKEQQVVDKRVQNGRTVTSVLTREITLK